MNGRAKMSTPLGFVPNVKVPIGIETDQTKVIYLTKNKYALVDVEDYDWLMRWWWSMQPCDKGSTYYAMRAQKINGKWRHVRMHREILGFSFDDGVIVDHINGHGWDNRKVNLRIASPVINGRNSRPYKTNRSGFKGVYLYQGKRWKAQINVNGKRVALGYYDTSVEAALAYDNAVIKYWGEGFPLNFGG